MTWKNWVNLAHEFVFLHPNEFDIEELQQLIPTKEYQNVNMHTLGSIWWDWMWFFGKPI